MKTPYARSGLMLALGVIGIFAFSGSAFAEPRVTGLGPTVASQYTETLIVKGSGWGDYDDRGEPSVFLSDKNDLEKTIQLKLERNYRDCSFVVGDSSITGKCTMNEGDMLLRTVLPTNLEEGEYIVSVVTKNNLQAGTTLPIIRLPDLRNANRPIMAITPTAGPVGTRVLITAGGFTKRTGLFLRFDGVKQGGILYTDENGFIAENIFTIPRSITKDFKVITIEPGKHTVELNDGGGHFQTVTFTVTGNNDAQKKKEDEEKAKKEQEEKEKADQEKKQKEEEQKKIDQGNQKKGEDQKKTGEEPKKEDPKKEEPQKKEEPKKEAERPFAGKACDTNLPRVWQEGCVDAAQQQKEQKPQTQLYTPDSTGKPCIEGLAITFQPGCVAQIKTEQTKPFTGRQCDANLPRTWQEGCVDAAQQQKEQKPQTQLYTPDSAGKTCKEGLAITFQPGCISQIPKTETIKPFAGKTCDANLPRTWQEGCIGEQKNMQTTQSTAQVTIKTAELPLCNASIPTYSQTNCRRE